MCYFCLEPKKDVETEVKINKAKKVRLVKELCQKVKKGKE